ncbi:flagellar assembly peptidoglycan hydrolase FlgJ [Uliginosibacterium sp. sgz301328]|uniref:flagellar assembly peptidoglycan hydrolase FlgJ n=1 Tax=Uliginosibacterium sp. sgz301328 TaxID=3243764 RepID=UPI00359E89E7
MLDQINTLDPNSLTALKRMSKDNSPAAIRSAAQQFEALFLQNMLKSMRDATVTSDATGSETTRFYQGLYDQQLAAMMAQRGGIGLADMMEKQMGAQAAAAQNAAATSTTTAANVPLSLDAARAAAAHAASGDKVPTTPQAFVDATWPQAAKAAQSLGVPAHFLIAQAALETGWGKSQIRNKDGTPSYNLFNIKAGSNWTGKVVEARTVEYENGQRKVRVERFRAYDSYEQAFQDYADLVGNSPRYAKVAGKTDGHAFARALQEGGYATDPSYADKLARVINGNALRQRLMASAASARG